MSFYEFFFADGYRLTVNIILFFAIISFGIFIYLVCSKKNSSFNIIFKIMLNVMTSALLSGIGYIFNWKEKNSEDLIFGEGPICPIQSVFLGLFQTSRESFLVSLSFLIFLNYKNPNINIDKNKKFIEIVIYLFGYGIPIIANIIYIIIGGYGKSDLFCFTKKKKIDNDDNDDYDIGNLISIIHYTYIIILVILNFCFTFYILSHEVCCKNNEENDLWEEEDNIACFNPLLKRLIFYPFAQIISLSGPLYYRIMSIIHNNGKTIYIMEDPAGICAILNCFSSFIHTFIFALSNNIIICKKNGEIKGNKNELLNNYNELEQVKYN